MNWRYRLILFFFAAAFFAIILRLFYWQSVRAEELRTLAEAQYGKSIQTSAKRGEIKTADSFPIAANKLAYRIFANPKEIRVKEKIARELSSLLSIDAGSLSARLSADKYWVPLASRVDSKVKDEIESLGFAGIGFEEQSIRLYPEASSAATLLGFVGKDLNGADKGYFGIEGYYDRQLRGKEGIAVQIHDALGRPILARMDDSKGEIDGRSLILHMDRGIQHLLEGELSKGIDKYGASSGMAVIMDPKTGGILGMAALPSFDPGNYQEYSDDVFKNPIISDTYEPGSTFKPLVMAAALDSGVVRSDTRCLACAGPIEIGEYQIKTWDNQYHANATMVDIIQYSDNVGMVFITQKLGIERMLAYIKKFGIGELTGIDLQGEVVPTLKSSDSWYPIDIATVGFGQGISLTPIELLSAFSAFANEGKRMEPHIVAKIETVQGEAIVIPPKVSSKPVSSKTAKIMTEILVNAVNKGVLKWTKPKGYRIAGKTGTAQVAIAGHYDPDKTIASFIGFAPADDPKFSMLVILENATKGTFGSVTAAPIFFNIAKQVLTYYSIPPTESE